MHSSYGAAVDRAAMGEAPDLARCLKSWAVIGRIGYSMVRSMLFNASKSIVKSAGSSYIAVMKVKTATGKRTKTTPSHQRSDSFVYRGVRITRTWTRSKRRKEIDEAMQKVMQRGPAEASAG